MVEDPEEDDDGIEDSPEGLRPDFERDIGSAYFTQARCNDCSRVVLVSVSYFNTPRCETCWRAHVAQCDR